MLLCMRGRNDFAPSSEIRRRLLIAVCVCVAVTGQSKGGASHTMILDIQHLSGKGEYALAAIRVRGRRASDSPESRPGTL